MESKLKKVMKVFEETVQLMEKISSNEKISVDDRNVIDDVKRELRRVISTVQKQNPNEEDSIMRMVAEKELSKICDKVSNTSIKEACLQQISLFTTASSSDDKDDDADADDDYDDDDEDDDDDDDRLPNKDAKLFTSSSDDDDDDDNDNESIRSRRNKRKTKQTASSAQHKQQCTDEKNIAYLRKRPELDVIDTLTRLAEQEADDYNETIQLMEDILKTHENILTDDESCYITQACQWIIGTQSEVNSCVNFIRDINLADGMLVIKRCRADVENKLQKVCRWMPNVMIKEIFVQHLDEFKKGPKPPKKRVAIPYTMNPAHIKELTIRKKKEMADILAKEKEKKYGFHDHNKCIEEREERDNPSFVHLGDWDPISEGRIDLLYAPGRDSKKAYENFKAEYEQWREEFDIQDE